MENNTKTTDQHEQNENPFESLNDILLQMLEVIKDINDDLREINKKMEKELWTTLPAEAPSSGDVNTAGLYWMTRQSARIAATSQRQKRKRKLNINK